MHAMTGVYDPFLTILSVTVAIFASYVALNLSYSVTKSQGNARIIWLGCGAVAMGVGIWSMHFIGMLAFEMPHMEMAYDIPLMSLSVLVAVFASALALFIVSRSRVTRASIYFGGVAMAAAIAGMHYIGMYSMRMAARIEWNLFLVAVSILIALVASFGALALCIRLRNQPQRSTLLVYSASTLMGIAISGMHYTGMLAATFIHDPTKEITASNLIVNSNLTVTTVSATLVILCIALASTIGQKLLVSRQEESDEILDKSEEKYRVLVEAVNDYAIFMLNPGGLITTWNKGAENITGYKESEIIGRHVSMLYYNVEGGFELTQKELDTVQNAGHFEGEGVRKRKDGTTFWANIVIDPLFNKKGKLTGFSKVIRDITQLKIAEEKSRNINEELERRVQARTIELQMRETQLRTISNAMPMLVAQVDRNERFLFVNDSFCDWFQRTREEITELTGRDVLGADRYPSNQIYIERALKGETVTYEKESISGDRQAILKITFVPEFDLEDKVKGFIVVASDVSNYKKIELELKNAKEEAEVANATKSSFLANMSHEIRTPLGAIIGFSELLVDDNMSVNEKQNTLEIIKRNGKLLSTIINDILDLSKVEAGKIEFENIDVSLSELLNDISVFLNLEATGKGIQFQILNQGPLPDKLKTDPTRLRQILFNIVGNAIKFTEKGKIELKVFVDNEDSSKLTFEIADTGTGISAEQAARLFSPFTQADATTTRRFGGTGLGLVLSKKFAQALGGDLVLKESQLAKGSVFKITINHGQDVMRFKNPTPATSTLVAQPSAERVEGVMPSKSLAELKVLVVDDSPDNLALIKRILTIAGADVEVAHNGSESIEKALKGSYNVVLMDLQMPGMDGFEATKALRTRGYLKPIIALTAHAMKEERKRTLENGFDNHLTKPVDRGVLIQVLAGYIS